MFILTETNSIANHYFAEMRDELIQRDSMRFRFNMERLGEILAYEVSKKLSYKPAEFKTPLGIKKINIIPEVPVLAVILRAGIPLYNGFQRIFDRSETAFIGAYRAPHKADFTFDIQMDYVAGPRLNDRVLIVIDPMLATGKSLVKAVEALMINGKPSEIHIVAAIAAQDGIDHIKQNLPNAHLWIGDIDEKLNDKFYIVPGLGDAGDLAFGGKI